MIFKIIGCACCLFFINPACNLFSQVVEKKIDNNVSLSMSLTESQIDGKGGILLNSKHGKGFEIGYLRLKEVHLNGSIGIGIHTGYRAINYAFQKDVGYETPIDFKEGKKLFLLSVPVLYRYSILPLKSSICFFDIGLNFHGYYTPDYELTVNYVDSNLINREIFAMFLKPNRNKTIHLLLGAGVQNIIEDLSIQLFYYPNILFDKPIYQGRYEFYDNMHVIENEGTVKESLSTFGFQCSYRINSK